MEKILHVSLLEKVRVKNQKFKNSKAKIINNIIKLIYFNLINTKYFI